jgi:hypothetical protein
VVFLDDKSRVFADGEVIEGDVAVQIIGNATHIKTALLFEVSLRKTSNNKALQTTLRKRFYSSSKV